MMHDYKAYHLDLTQSGRERGGNGAGQEQKESISITVYFSTNLQLVLPS